MKAKRSILFALSTLLIMGTVFRGGYRIELNGQTLPGVYAPDTVKKAESLARRAAEEICRGDESPGYTLKPAICLKYQETPELTRQLLTSYEGVAELYAVYAGEELLGLTSDPGIIWAIREDYIAAGADYNTASAYLTKEISTKQVLSCPEYESSVIDLSRSLIECTDVVYVQFPDAKG